MYSTCLHCHRKLDRNEAIEAFQVGSKLAFDSEKGRLWAICPSCARWNLTPIEERWEAVEQCEKLFGEKSIIQRCRRLTTGRSVSSSVDCEDRMR